MESASLGSAIPHEAPSDHYGRRRRALNTVAVLAAVLLVLLTVGAAILYSSLPSVSDAPARVAASLREHGGIAVHVAPAMRVARATVAIEDRRFFHHGAIDPIAIGRVAVDSVLHPGRDPGGSTITQQLAKVLYNEPSTILGRLRAIGLAFKLEQHYSKPRILSMYLNSVYYGRGYWGIERASMGYFGRPVSQLSWDQAALLAGLPQAPSLLDPVAHPEAAADRRAQVLEELERSGALSPAREQALEAAPLQLRH